MILNINEQVNPWISSIDVENNQEYLNNLLNIGYNISKSVKLEDTNQNIMKYLNDQDVKNGNVINTIDQRIESINDLQKNSLDSFDHKIQLLEHRNMVALENQNERFITLIENISGKSKTSSIKGRIAENFLENVIKDLFPSYSLDVTAQTGHEADMVLYKDSLKILIESKNYSNVVPTKEITKFKLDLKRMNIKHGLFVSFSSKITGKQNIEIEHYDDTVILYLSCIEFDREIINMALTLLIYLSKLTNDKQFISGPLLSEKANEILLIVNDLNKLYTTLSKNKYTLLEEKKKISTSLDNIHTAYIENEVVMKNIIDEIQNKIHIKISEINNNSVNLEELNPEEYLDDSCIELGNKILTKIVLSGYQISSNSVNNIDISKNNIIVTKASFTKTKCKLHILPKNCKFEITKTCLSCLDSCLLIMENL